ncbi:YusW family protein [Bacillus gobiensis]|uniref:YusW family protein n=1 Tax=Bacillus gobiensis TaxID=1441095 RepID=UPI003D1950D5
MRLSLQMMMIVCVAITSGCGLAGLEKTEDRSVNFADAVDVDQSTLPFKSFRLAVYYGQGNQDSFQAIYRNSPEETAEIKDGLSGVNHIGDEALVEMKMMLDELQPENNQSEDSLVHDILSSFNLEEDYEKLDLEITMKDGNQLNYHKKSPHKS